MQRLATWNVNSIRARPHLVERLVTEQAPDLLCLQETKCADGAFPRAMLERLGYRHIHVRGQRMHHGVAIVGRVPFEPVNSFDWQGNGEARHAAVRLTSGPAAGLVVHNVYVPAGGDLPDRAINPKFGQKLDFLERMAQWADRLDSPSLLVGDLNVAPLPEDVWSHSALLDVVSHTPVEVAALERLRDAHGWVDLGRAHVPPPQRLYTWWSYRAIDWRRSDRGRRLDHVWSSPVLASALVRVDTLVDARDWPRPSDHVPVVAEFAW